MIHILSRILKTGILTESFSSTDDERSSISDAQAAIHSVMGRALCIRHVDAGSCNGCELEIQALNNPYYNLEGIGIRFVASPRHADLLLVTGPVSVNMEVALRRTYEAMPKPKWVVALGDCGACGGIFGTSYASRGGVSNIVPVNFTIPGCPPEPMEIMRGILNTVCLPASSGVTGKSTLRRDQAGPP